MADRMGQFIKKTVFDGREPQKRRVPGYARKANTPHGIIALAAGLSGTRLDLSREKPSKNIIDLRRKHSTKEQRTQYDADRMRAADLLRATYDVTPRRKPKRP